MRLTEVCQLYVDDIREIDETFCFDVKAETEDKRLKTEDSRRVIPIHPKLIDLGFLDYVSRVKAKGESHLWKDIDQRYGKYGADFSKWYGRFKKTFGWNRQKNFHSFRHNFADALKQSRTEGTIIDELLGHKTENLAMSRYGKAYEINTKRAVIEKLDYGIDLTRLKAPRA